MTKRILIAGFQHETNTFAPTKANYESFVRGEMYPAMARGGAVLDLAGVNIPIGGFIQTVSGDGVDLAPVIWAGASPSAHVTADAFERIAGEIVVQSQTGHFDAVYLDLHGAMVTEYYDDGEGELLRRVRAAVGPAVPIVASLDLHANVTDAMLRHADALVAYRTYPHVDMAQTGARAANILLSLIETGRKLHSYWRRLPFLIPINAQVSSMEPARSIYHLLESMELSSSATLSFAPGFPAADFPECAGVVWGVGSDVDVIRRDVDILYNRILLCEPDWALHLLEPRKAVLEAQRIAYGAIRPVVIADTQDNPGAGGDSDTTGMIRALLERGVTGAAIGLIVDPEVARAAHEAGIGATLEMDLGGRSNSPGDAPLRQRYRVEQLSDGTCRFDGPMLNGMRANVGPSARLSVGGVEIVVSTTKTQMLDRNLFRMVGIDPEKKKIVVVKSSVHFRADFEPIAEAILIAKSPGPVAADPRDLPWRNLRDGTRLAPLGMAFSAAARSEQTRQQWPKG